MKTCLLKLSILLAVLCAVFLVAPYHSFGYEAWFDDFESDHWADNWSVFQAGGVVSRESNNTLNNSYSLKMVDNVSGPTFYLRRSISIPDNATTVTIRLSLKVNSYESSYKHGPHIILTNTSSLLDPFNYPFVLFTTNQYNPYQLAKRMGTCGSAQMFAPTGLFLNVGTWYDIEIKANPVTNETTLRAKKSLSADLPYIDYGTYVNDICARPFDRIFLGTGLGSTTGANTEFDNISVAIDLEENNTPSADAGPNINISTEQVSSTVINGNAIDIDGDFLTCRWLEDGVVLSDWTPVDPSGECSLNLNAISLSIGSHRLILEASDGKATSSDDTNLTIENSAPHAAPSGAGTYEINTPVNLTGQVSDFDGDTLSYIWKEGPETLCFGTVETEAGGFGVDLPVPCTVSGFSLGTHTITLLVDDGVNPPVGSDLVIEIIDDITPTLKPVVDKTILWPPNHIMLPVAITANAADNSGLPVTLTVLVSSNEAVDGLGDGDKTPDWTEPFVDQDNGVIYLQLRAERSGTGNGREYTVTITATDTSGNASVATVTIIVPHDKAKK